MRKSIIVIALVIPILVGVPMFAWFSCSNWRPAIVDCIPYQEFSRLTREVNREISSADSDLTLGSIMQKRSLPIERIVSDLRRNGSLEVDPSLLAQKGRMTYTFNLRQGCFLVHRHLKVRLYWKAGQHIQIDPKPELMLSSNVVCRQIRRRV